MLTSLTSYVDSALERPFVNAGTPGETFTNEGREDETSFTQELRLNWDSASLQAVAGLYYAREESEVANARALPFGGGWRDISTSERDSDNVALFGEATWRFAPRWRLVAGGRIDHLTQSTASTFKRDNFNPASADVSTASSSDSRETVFLPKAGVIYDLAERQTLGFTIQRGFRSGGSAIDFNGEAYEIAPEYTWTYEAAYRARLGASTTLNANIFYTDWSDQQVELQLVPGDFTTQIIANAGSSRLYGGEVEVRAQLFVKSKPSVAWVDTKFEEIQDSLGCPYSPSQMNRLSSWPDAGAASPTRGEGVGRTSRAIRRRNR